MTRTARFQVAAHRSSEHRQIPQCIEHLVAHEFVGETQTTYIQYTRIVEHHGVIQ